MNKFSETLVREPCIRKEVASDSGLVSTDKANYARAGFCD
jgi:hypothetical protein